MENGGMIGAAKKELVGLISTWDQFRRTVAFIAVLCVFFCVGLLIVIYIFRSWGVQILSTESGTAIQFTEFNRKTTFYTVLIHPQDWNDSGISVEQGDELTITAFGNVNLALGLMNEDLITQYKHRKQNQLIGKSRRVSAMGETQVNQSLLRWPWNGPQGLDPKDVTDRDIRQTQQEEAPTRIRPDANLGQLIAAIIPGNECPSNGVTKADYQLRAYSSEVTFTAEKTGRLCFIVNDHRSEKHDENRLFWQDNIGFFAANIKKVKSK